MPGDSLIRVTSNLSRKQTSSLKLVHTDPASDVTCRYAHKLKTLLSMAVFIQSLEANSGGSDAQNAFSWGTCSNLLSNHKRNLNRNPKRDLMHFERDIQISGLKEAAQEFT